MGKYTHPGYNMGLLFYLVAVNSPFISIMILLKNKSNINIYFKEHIGQKREVFISMFLAFIFILCQFLLPMLFNNINIFGNIFQVIIYFPVMIFIGGTEEIGWRGFLYNKFMKKYYLIKTVFLAYFLCLLWHIPLCFIEGTYQNNYPYWLYAISLIGTTFSLIAIRYISNSIIGCILFHSLVNSIVSYGINIEGFSGLIYSTITQIIMALFLCLYKYKSVKSCIINNAK
jgi:membrane protease YdiL (CAAX protease family)